MSVRLKVISLRVLVILGAAALVAATLWFYFLFHTSPGQPVPETGRTEMLTERSYPFFVRPADVVIHRVLICVGLITLVGVWFVDRRGKRRRNRPNLVPPERPHDQPFFEIPTEDDIYTGKVVAFIVVASIFSAMVLVTSGYVPFEWLAP